MNLIFNYENPVHHFKATGQMTAQDLKVIRAALYRLFESNPSYVVLNLSGVINLDQTPKILYTQVITELTSLALSKKIFFRVNKNEEEQTDSIHAILEEALHEKQALMNSKKQVKEELKNTARALFEENESLKKQLNVLKDRPTQDSGNSLGTLLDKLWSTK